MTQPRETLDAALQHLRAGSVDEAETQYQSILQNHADCAEAWHFLGVIENQRGNPKTAEPLARRAVGLVNDDPRFHSGLGFSLVLLHRLEEGEACMRAALALDPGFVDAQFNLGNILQTLGRGDEAIAAFQRTLELAPNHMKALNNLGMTLRTKRRLKEAEDCFRQAATLNPSDSAVLTNLCICLELRNRLEEAHDLAQTLVKHAPGHPHTNLLAARLERRTGRLREAVDRLRPFVEKAPWPKIKREAAFDLGSALESLDKPDEAFEAFTTANVLVAKAMDEKGIDEDAYFLRVEQTRDWFTAERLSRWNIPAAADPAPPPVFLVGFPRSGTAHLEQILAAHPNLATTGEQSPLAKVEEALCRDHDYPACLETMSGEEITQWRARYRAWARESVDGDPATMRLVDQLPLNIVRLGLVNRLFPDAKVIVALRDPRDACLRCFMQHFQINEATANFCDLGATARLYGAIMDLWFQYRDALTLPWIEYRHEDLVSDTEGTTRRVLDFLDEPWTDDITQEVPTHSVGRWWRYQEFLSPIMPILQPHIDALGYDEDPSI
jgi:Flp pilus assembly protein TadD